MELKCALTVASHFANIELVQLVLDDVAGSRQHAAGIDAFVGLEALDVVWRACGRKDSPAAFAQRAGGSKPNAG